MPPPRRSTRRQSLAPMGSKKPATTKVSSPLTKLKSPGEGEEQWISGHAGLFKTPKVPSPPKRRNTTSRRTSIYKKVTGDKSLPATIIRLNQSPAVFKEVSTTTVVTKSVVQANTSSPVLTRTRRQSVYKQNKSPKKVVISPTVKRASPAQVSSVGRGRRTTRARGMTASNITSPKETEKSPQQSLSPAKKVQQKTPSPGRSLKRKSPKKPRSPSKSPKRSRSKSRSPKKAKQSKIPTLKSPKSPQTSSVAKKRRSVEKPSSSPPKKGVKTPPKTSRTPVVVLEKTPIQEKSVAKKSRTPSPQRKVQKSPATPNTAKKSKATTVSSSKVKSSKAKSSHKKRVRMTAESPKSSPVSFRKTPGPAGNRKTPRTARNVSLQQSPLLAEGEKPKAASTSRVVMKTPKRKLVTSALSSPAMVNEVAVQSPSSTKTPVRAARANTTLTSSVKVVESSSKKRVVISAEDIMTPPKAARVLGKTPASKRKKTPAARVVQTSTPRTSSRKRSAPEIPVSEIRPAKVKAAKKESPLLSADESINDDVPDDTETSVVEVSSAELSDTKELVVATERSWLSWCTIL